MTALGECPVKMTDDQPFLVVKPDGEILDPFRATKCMVEVLRTVDGATEPKSGYFREPGRGLLPFVRYTYPSRQDHKPTVVTFTADADPTTGGFEASMSGLFASPDNGPDEYGAEKIVQLWKARCGVDAGVNFP